MNSRHPLFRASWALHIVNSVLTLFVVFELLFFKELTSNTAFVIATLHLTVLLIVPRLRLLKSLKRYDNLLLYTAKRSKWLGLWMATWFFVYACMLRTVDHLSLIPSQIFLGNIILIILSTLTLLSNNWSYQHIRLWKHINMLIWAIPGLLLSYVLVSPGLMQSSRFIAIAALLLIELSGVTGIFVNQPDYFARIRLYLIAASVSVGAIGFMFPVRY